MVNRAPPCHIGVNGAAPTQTDWGNKMIASNGGVMATSPMPVMSGSGAGGLRQPRKGWNARTMSRSRLHVFYSGTVQGVGFRYSVKMLAGGFDVTGSVRNLADGRVELAAEGEKDELKAFQQAIRESELGHFIRKEDVQWEEAQGSFRGFEIGR